MDVDVRWLALVQEANRRAGRRWVAGRSKRPPLRATRALRPRALPHAQRSREPIGLVVHPVGTLLSRHRKRIREKEAKMRAGRPVGGDAARANTSRLAEKAQMLPQGTRILSRTPTMRGDSESSSDSDESDDDGGVFTKREREEMLRLFRQCDPKKHGTIPRNKIGQIVRFLGYLLPDEEIQPIVEEHVVMDVADESEYLNAIADILITNHMHCHKLFTAADADGSGTMDAEEMRAMFLGMNIDISQKKLEEVIEEVDTDRNGINFEELLDVLADYRETNGFTHAECASLSEVFEKFSDSDDEVGAEQFSQLFTYCGYMGKDAYRLVADMDLDGSGKLSLQEYFKVMRLVANEERYLLRASYDLARAEDDAAKEGVPLSDGKVQATLMELTELQMSDEYIAVTGLSVGFDLEFEQWWDVVADLRASFGMTRITRQSYEATFNEVSSTGELAVGQVIMALQRLGIVMPYHKVQPVFKAIDLSGDGTLDVTEFLRLMSMLHKDELASLQGIVDSAYQRYKQSLPEESILPEEPKPRRGSNSRSGFRVPPNCCCYPGKKLGKVLDLLHIPQSSVEGAVLPVEEWWSLKNLSSAVTSCRAFVMEQVKANCGFTQEEAEAYREQFCSLLPERREMADGREVVMEDALEIKEVILLLGMLNRQPRTFAEQRVLQKILDQVRLPGPTLKLDFRGFLGMMKHFADSEEKERREQEIEAAQETGLPYSQVNELRTMHSLFTAGSGGYLDLATLKSALTHVGFRLATEQDEEALEERFIQVTRGSCSRGCDFSQFLRLVKILLNENFLNANLIFTEFFRNQARPRTADTWGSLGSL